MHGYRHAASGVVVAALLATAAALPAQERERRAIRADDVAIYNLAGELRAEAGSGSEVVVEVVRGGRDGDRLRVETGRIGGRETLRVIYPDDDIVYSGSGSGGSTDMTVRDDGTFGDGSRGGRRVRIRSRGSGLDAYADLRVSIPAGRRVALYLGVGRVSIANVDGEMRVDAAAASVAAGGTRGTLSINTESGSERVSGAEGDVSIDTGSGSAEVSGVRGETLDIDTGSGGVSATDVDVRLLNVDVGSGGINVRRVRAPDIRLHAGSGSIPLIPDGDMRPLDVDTDSG